MTTSPASRGANLPARSSFYWIGGWTTAVYLVTALFYLRGSDVYSHTERELFSWFLVPSLLFLFWKGYRFIDRSPELPGIRAIVGFAGVFSLLAFFTFPFHSTDVFGYINRGWQQLHYGLNPYVYVLDQIPNWRQDPMLRAHWIYNPEPYGFLFSLLARLLCWIGNGNWWLTLGLFKLVNLAAYGLSAWLVWAGAARLGMARPIRALYLFLWNPLILMHHIANGHNDILTGCLVVLALYLAVAESYFWILPVLAAATLLKYAPAIMIPFALVLVWRKAGWKVVVASCLLCAALTGATSAPFLLEWKILLIRLPQIAFNATLPDNSLHSLLIHVYENAARLIPRLALFHDTVNGAIKLALRLGLLFFLVLQGLRMRGQKSIEAFIEISLLALFVLLCVASSKFNAWYLGILLPPALLLEENHWLRRLIVLITGAELLSLTFFKQAYMLNYFAMICVPAWIVFRQVRREKVSRETGS